MINGVGVVIAFNLIENARIEQRGGEKLVYVCNFIASESERYSGGTVPSGKTCNTNKNNIIMINHN